MLPLIVFICFLESVRQRKMFSHWKKDIFLFQVFDLRFHKNFLFYFTTLSGSQSEPKSATIFGFWSSQTIRILLDSDLNPQHLSWAVLHIQNYFFDFCLSLSPEVTTLFIRMSFQLWWGNETDQSKSSFAISHTISIPFEMVFWD
jgi:hypothetical protein